MVSVLPLVLAFFVSMVLAWVFFKFMQRKSVIREAVQISQAYWDAEKRENNRRLFGDPDID